MTLKKFSTFGYWDFEKVVLLLGLLVAIVTLIYTVQPAFLFPENVDYSEIKLEKTLLSQQYLINFENVNKSIELEKLESFEYLNADISNEKQVILKIAEYDSDSSDKFIFIALTDPNNIIRFVSMPLDDETLINEPLSSVLRKISVQKRIKIKIPASDELNIEGTWHLNIYLYNSEKELSLVIIRPLDLSASSNKNDFVSNILFSIIIISAFPIFFRIISYVKSDIEPDSLVRVDAVNANQPNQSQKSRELNEIQGIIVDVPRYGLIKRCSDCGQIMEKGICRKHGKVEGEYDLYIEAILFDGFSEHIIMIEKPIIENLLKVDLDQCKAIATEYLDSSIIRKMIEKQMLGKFYIINGIYLAEGMKAKSIKINSQITRMDLLSLYDRWKMSKEN